LRLKVKLQASRENLEKIRLFSEEFIDLLGVDMISGFQIKLATDEICMNAVDHAMEFSGYFEYLVTVTPNTINIQVRDFAGKVFNPMYFLVMSEDQNSLMKAGGRGLKIVTEVADNFVIFTVPGEETVVSFSKKLEVPKLNKNEIKALTEKYFFSLDYTLEI